jgi:hypothetical protein
MRVDPVTGLDLRMGTGGWAFAADHAARIAAHWAERVARNARLWNGEVLICIMAEVRDGVLTARFQRSDYASFVAWRDWGTPDAAVRNCFGTPVVLTADGAMVFGEMAGHTLNAGAIYPPSGSLEPRDVTPDGRVDVLGSMALELAEETGLDAGEAQPGAMLVIHDAHRLAVARALHLPHRFAEIESRFETHRASSVDAELARLVAIRGADEIHAAMPGFAQEIVRRFDFWRERS